jgi:hypothetical protein
MRVRMCVRAFTCVVASVSLRMCVGCLSAFARASCCGRASAALSLRAVQAGEEATIAFGEHGEDEVYFETDDESER